MCHLYGKFASYLRRVLCKTRLIFPRINGPNVSYYAKLVKDAFPRVSSKEDANHVSSGANSSLTRVELSSSQDEGLKGLSFSNGMIPKRVVL